MKFDYGKLRKELRERYSKLTKEELIEECISLKLSELATDDFLKYCEKIEVS